jgi:hypothetical protein
MKRKNIERKKEIKNISHRQESGESRERRSWERGTAAEEEEEREESEVREFRTRIKRTEKEVQRRLEDNNNRKCYDQEEEEVERIRGEISMKMTMRAQRRRRMRRINSSHEKEPIKRRLLLS